MIGYTGTIHCYMNNLIHKIKCTLIRILYDLMLFQGKNYLGGGVNPRLTTINSHSIQNKLKASKKSLSFRKSDLWLKVKIGAKFETYQT